MSCKFKLVEKKHPLTRLEASKSGIKYVFHDLLDDPSKLSFR